MIQILTYHVANLAHAKVGERFTFKEQDYTVEALEPYVNDAGKDCLIVTVSTFCTICGDLFEMTTRRRPKWLPRTCGHHKGPKPRPRLPDAPHANVEPIKGIPPYEVRAKVL